MLTKKGDGEPEKLLSTDKDKKLSMVVRLKKPTERPTNSQAVILC